MELNKKAIYKRPWFIVIALFIVVGAIGENSETVIQEQQSSQNSTTEENVATQEKAEEKVEDNVPTEYKSALKKAKLYSDTMNMSKIGIYKQLTSEYGEKFTEEAAQYAIDNLQ